MYAYCGKQCGSTTSTASWPSADNQIPVDTTCTRCKDAFLQSEMEHSRVKAAD